jgi:hypothetical protein
MEWEQLRKLSACRHPTVHPSEIQTRHSKPHICTKLAGIMETLLTLTFPNTARWTGTGPVIRYTNMLRRQTALFTVGQAPCELISNLHPHVIGRGGGIRRKFTLLRYDVMHSGILETLKKTLLSPSEMGVPEDGVKRFFWNLWYIFTKPHGVTSQHAAVFKPMAVTTVMCGELGRWEI